MPDQYANPANPQAHYETTAVEIIDDCPEIDVFVAGLGTGGTLTGVGRRLREYRSNVKVYAAEPMPGEMVQGLRSFDEASCPSLRCVRAGWHASSSRPRTRSRPCAG